MLMPDVQNVTTTDLSSKFTVCAFKTLSSEFDEQRAMAQPRYCGGGPVLSQCLMKKGRVIDGDLTSVAAYNTVSHFIYL